MAAFGAGGFDEATLDPARRSTLALVRKLAIEGTKEKTAAHGICVILVPNAKVGFVFSKDEDGDSVFGRIGDPMYDFRTTPVPFDRISTFQSCAREDGAMLVTEARTLLCGNYFVMDTRKGDNSDGQGARHLAASAAAKSLQTFAIKVRRRSSHAPTPYIAEESPSEEGRKTQSSHLRPRS